MCLHKCCYASYVLNRFSRVQLSVTPWTVAHQAPLSMRFPWQESWSGLPFLSPGDLPDPGIKPTSSALASRFFTAKESGKPIINDYFILIYPKLHFFLLSVNIPPKKIHPNFLIVILASLSTYSIAGK